jgi:hypothetical protein
VTINRLAWAIHHSLHSGAFALEMDIRALDKAADELTGAEDCA